MAEGHPSAARYPLSMLWHEIQIAKRRHNMRSVTEALLIQGAVAALLDKKAGKEFQKHIKALTDDH